MASLDAPAIRALVVDDDPAVCNSLCDYLVQNGLEATGAADLATAQHLLSRHAFDVAVFDLMLGQANSMDLMRHIVARGGPPVIIVSAIHGEADRVLGLELGAADYVGKPFSYRELLARIRTVLRRREARPPLEPRRIARFGSWIVDLGAHTISDAAGEHLDLTGGELTLLQAFLAHPHRVLTRSAIMRLTGETKQTSSIARSTCWWRACGTSSKRAAARRRVSTRSAAKATASTTTSPGTTTSAAATRRFVATARVNER